MFGAQDGHLVLGSQKNGNDSGEHIVPEERGAWGDM